MAEMNCKQDHIGNDTRHILILKKKKMQWATQIYQIREKKKKYKNKIKYLFAWIYPSMEEYFRNQRNFHLFEI